MSEFLTLDKINSYNISLDFSDFIWNVVIQWEWFAKKTVGAQWVRATDSISANIAEGFGRYSKKDKVHFYRYSQGSLLETVDWFTKSKNRNLLDDNQIIYIEDKLSVLPKEINQLIKFTNEKLKF